MQGTLIFVHGTGVRQADHDASLTAIRDGAARNGLTGITIVGCLWGDHAGVKLDRVEATLPPGTSTRSLTAAPPTAAELEVATWALLLDDPLFELRVAAQGAPAAGGVVIGALPPDQEAVARLNALATAPLDLSDTGLGQAEIAAAARRVATAPELRGAALAAGSADDPDLLAAMARAVVADALAARRGDPAAALAPAAVNGAVRDALVARVQAALTVGPTRSLTGWLKDRLTGFVTGKVTDYVLDRRRQVALTSVPKAGDIVFYQRRGDAISQFVEQALTGLAPPVVAVCHSLGGIILVDLLTRPNPPRVDLLVTLGSQSPILYALDALQHLRLDQAQPVPFTPWLNVYNRADFLSFRAAEIFGNRPNIIDEEIDPGVPFPEAHGSYFHSDRVYQLIRQHWPGP
jgi:hypothetical protein